MTRYAIKNFMDTHDRLADNPDREMRFLRDELESTQLGVSLSRLEPGFHSSMGHHHREQEEAYVVVQGSGRVKLDDEIHELRQWDVVRVAPEVVRAFEAGSDGLLLIALGGPKPEGGDGVRDDDFWPQD
jgi:uncharacterized cupin superfamily protein